MDGSKDHAYQGQNDQDNIHQAQYSPASVFFHPEKSKGSKKQEQSIAYYNSVPKYII